MISFGNPSVIEYDTNAHAYQIHIEKPIAGVTALDRIYHNIQYVKKAHICLSGGVDSQFWLRVCDHFNIPYRVSTYLIFWEGSPINTGDFVNAQLLVNKYGCDQQVIRIDLDQFLNSPECARLAKKYKTNSQQLALHMHYLEQVVNTEETFFLGGECLYLVNEANVPGVLGAEPARLKDSITYKEFFEQNNAKYFKDVFYLDRQMFYFGLRASIDVVKQRNIHLDKPLKGDYTTIQTDNLQVKSAIWDSILPGSTNTLIKRTGFEDLKKYLAMKTGVYNEFDIRYRDFLKTVTSGMQLEMKSDPVFRVRNTKVLFELYKEFEQAKIDYNSRPVVQYLFDF